MTANRLTELCKCVFTDIDSQLVSVTGETFINCTANTSNNARVNIQSTGFWVSGHQAFFDVRVFIPNTDQSPNKGLLNCYIQHEKEKKQPCNKRVLEIDRESFTPLVISMFTWIKEP